MTEQSHDRQNVGLMDVIKCRCKRHPDVVWANDSSETVLTCFLQETTELCRVDGSTAVFAKQWKGIRANRFDVTRQNTV